MQTQANKMSQKIILVIYARKCVGYKLKTRSSFDLVCDLVCWWLVDVFNGTLLTFNTFVLFFALFNRMYMKVFVQMSNLNLHLKLFTVKKKQTNSFDYLLETLQFIFTINYVHFFFLSMLFTYRIQDRNYHMFSLQM